MPLKTSDWLSIGQVAKRTGLSVSAIRFYESKGLIEPGRNAGGQRRYRRSDIRRFSFVVVTQQLGFSIGEIRDVLHTLPEERTPNRKDWTRISRQIRGRLDAKIEALELLRDKLDGCIGCGCLSLKRCALYNPQDEAAGTGAGARYLAGDRHDVTGDQQSGPVQAAGPPAPGPAAAPLVVAHERGDDAGEQRRHVA